MRKLVVFFLGAALLAGCGNGGKPIRMITEAAFPPCEFLRGEREIVGVDVEIGRAVAKRLGRGFEVDSNDFDSVLPAVMNGRADFAAAGITVTEARKRLVDFSIPYMTAGIVVVYRKSDPFRDVAQLKGKRISVQSGTTSDDFVRNELKQEATGFGTAAEAIIGLKTGAFDFVIADIGVAKHCVRGESGLAVSDFLTSEDYAIAVAKGRPELLKAINETIAELKAAGTIAQWVEDYTVEADGQEEN